MSSQLEGVSKEQSCFDFCSVDLHPKTIERGGREVLQKSAYELFSSVKTQSRDKIWCKKLNKLLGVGVGNALCSIFCDCNGVSTRRIARQNERQPTSTISINFIRKLGKNYTVFSKNTFGDNYFIVILKRERVRVINHKASIKDS